MCKGLFKEVVGPQSPSLLPNTDGSHSQVTGDRTVSIDRRGVVKSDSYLISSAHSVFSRKRDFAQKDLEDILSSRSVNAQHIIPKRKGSLNKSVDSGSSKTLRKCAIIIVMVMYSVLH